MIYSSELLQNASLINLEQKDIFQTYPTCLPVQIWGKNKLSLKTSSADASSANHAVGEHARNAFQLSIISIKNQKPEMEMNWNILFHVL